MKQALLLPILKRAWEEDYADTRPAISLHTSHNLIDHDPYLDEGEKDQIHDTLVRAGIMEGSPRAGLVSTKQIVHGAVGAGLGYYGGKALAGILGLSATNQRRLSHMGAIAGILRGTGIWS